jgi:hypothetical protein
MNTLVSGLLLSTARKASIDCSFGRLRGVHDLNFGGGGLPESLSNLLGMGASAPVQLSQGLAGRSSR